MRGSKQGRTFLYTKRQFTSPDEHALRKETNTHSHQLS